MVRLADRHAQVRFVKRDVSRLDIEAVSTDLGAALVTTREQTLLDLAKRPTLGNAADQLTEAMTMLFELSDPDVLEELAARQHLRAALRKAREWVS